MDLNLNDKDLKHKKFVGKFKDDKSCHIESELLMGKRLSSTSHRNNGLSGSDKMEENPGRPRIYGNIVKVRDELSRERSLVRDSSLDQ